MVGGMLNKNLFERENKVKFEIKNGYLNVFDPRSVNSSKASTKGSGYKDNSLNKSKLRNQLG